MKADPSRMIPRKFAAKLKILVAIFGEWKAISTSDRVPEKVLHADSILKFYAVMKFTLIISRNYWRRYKANLDYNQICFFCRVQVEKSLSVVCAKDDTVTEEKPENSEVPLIKVRSAPARSRTPFGKQGSPLRNTTASKPPPYIFALDHKETKFVPKIEVVLRPFSERRLSSDNAFCFTCRRKTNNQDFQAVGAELGFFRGKPPLTQFTRLGCFKSQTRTEQLSAKYSLKKDESAAIRQTLHSVDGVRHRFNHHMQQRSIKNTEKTIAVCRTHRPVLAHRAGAEPHAPGQFLFTKNIG